MARQDRVCESCGAAFGDVRHFVADCPALLAPGGESTGRGVWSVVSAAHTPHEARDWREAARWVECRWRRKEKLRREPSVGDGPGAGGVAVGEAMAEVVHRPRSVGRKCRKPVLQPTLPTIHENEPLFHVERSGVGDVAAGTGSGRRVSRERRKQPFLPTLPTIHENEPLFDGGPDHASLGSV